MSNKLEPRNPDSFTIVFYENDGTHSELDDADTKQGLLQQAEYILQRSGPAQRGAVNGTTVGQIIIDDDVAFTFNDEPVDTATIGEAIAEAIVDAIRHGIRNEYAETPADADERADYAEAPADADEGAVADGTVTDETNDKPGATDVVATAAANAAQTTKDAVVKTALVVASATEAALGAVAAAGVSAGIWAASAVTTARSGIRRMLRHRKADTPNAVPPHARGQ